MSNIVRIVILTLLIPTMTYGEEKHAHDGHEEMKVGIEALSKGLRDLLSKEMIAIQNGMISIIPAYNSGNWPEIEMTADKIKKSYILKQSLTEEQIHELHGVLPEVFLEKDQHFHYLAGMLQRASSEKKEELVNFYFSEMNRSCLSCHSAFATHKFPALSKSKTETEHNH